MNMNENSEQQIYAIFLFDNSHAAIKAELATKKCFPTSRLIPLPPEVSAGCGMVLRTEADDAEAVAQSLHTADIEITGIYTLKISDGKRSVEKRSL